MSALCKALLDRWVVFHKDKLLANKVGGVLAVGGGRNAGVELTIRSVQVALMAQQMIVVGDAPPTGHWGGPSGAVTRPSPAVRNPTSPGTRPAFLRSRTLAAGWWRLPCGCTCRTGVPPDGPAAGKGMDMLEPWFSTFELPLTFDQFQQLPRNTAFKYEYFGGKPD